ncbi:hypothetical protein ABIC73_002891 [Prescottella equi]
MPERGPVLRESDEAAIGLVEDGASAAGVRPSIHATFPFIGKR